MIQDVIVILIVISTIIYAAFTAVNRLRERRNKSACSGGCQGCSLNKQSSTKSCSQEEPIIKNSRNILMN